MFIYLSLTEFSILSFRFMMEDAGAKMMRDICGKYTVGIWGSANQKDPDNLTTAKYLISLGATFVNTDLPKTFNM